MVSFFGIMVHTASASQLKMTMGAMAIGALILAILTGLGSFMLGRNRRQIEGV